MPAIPEISLRNGQPPPVIGDHPPSASQSLGKIQPGLFVSVGVSPSPPGFRERPKCLPAPVRQLHWAISKQPLAMMLSQPSSLPSRLSENGATNSSGSPPPRGVHRHRTTL